MQTAEHATAIRLERTYAHPVHRVWQAISDENQIAKWFIKADFKPVVGYPYTFTHEGTEITGQVIEATPPRVLTYTWRVGAMPVSTTVRWTLSESAEGTHLLLEHWGIEAFADSAPNMFSAFSSGWKTCMEELATYLQADEAS